MSSAAANLVPAVVPPASRPGRDPRGSAGGFDASLVRVGRQQVRIGRLGGPAGGTPLLMFNGIGANLELLAPLAQALGREVLTFDVPGVGQSPLPARPYRLLGLARMVAAILDQLDLATVDVFGVSWGGVAAQQFVRSFPHRTRRVVLCATSPGTLMVPPNPLVALRMATPLRYVSREYARQIAGGIYGGDFRRGIADVAEHFEQIQWQSRSGYYLQILAALGWTSLHWLHRLRQPTLLLAGTDDPIVPLANAHLMHALVPDSELRLYDCGHLFLLTRLADVARDIDRFLDEDRTSTDQRTHPRSR